MVSHQLNCCVVPHLSIKCGKFAVFIHYTVITSFDKLASYVLGVYTVAKKQSYSRCHMYSDCNTTGSQGRYNALTHIASPHMH